MKVVNITRGELTPEEKTAINVLASIDCAELNCVFCPLNVVGDGAFTCAHIASLKVKRNSGDF